MIGAVPLTRWIFLLMVSVLCPKLFARKKVHLNASWPFPQLSLRS